MEQLFNKYPEHTLNLLIEKNYGYLHNIDISELKYKFIKLNIIVSIVLNILNNNNLIEKKNLLKEIINDINKLCDIKLNSKQCFNIISYIVKNKNEIDNICLSNNDYKYLIKYNNNDYITNIEPFIGQIGGSNFFDILSGPNSSNIIKIIDVIQLLLDLISYIPAIGSITQFINMIIYLIRNEYDNAIISLFGIIPIIGVIIGVPIKYIRKYGKWKNSINDSIKKYQNKDDIINNNYQLQ